MKPYTRGKLIQTLQDKWKLQFVQESEDFDGRPEAVWISAENGETHKDVPLFDYWLSEFGTEGEGFGNIWPRMNDALAKWIEERGWYFEWNDAGTIFAYRID